MLRSHTDEHLLWFCHSLSVFFGIFFCLFSICLLFSELPRDCVIRNGSSISAHGCVWLLLIVPLKKRSTWYLDLKFWSWWWTYLDVPDVRLVRRLRTVEKNTGLMWFKLKLWPLERLSLPLINSFTKSTLSMFSFQRASSQSQPDAKLIPAKSFWRSIDYGSKWCVSEENAASKTCSSNCFNKCKSKVSFSPFW